MAENKTLLTDISETMIRKGTFEQKKQFAITMMLAHDMVIAAKEITINEKNVDMLICGWAFFMSNRRYHPSVVPIPASWPDDVRKRN